MSSKKLVVLFAGLCAVITMLVGFKVQRRTVSTYKFPRLMYFPPLKAGKDVTDEAALVGRYLFYDSILSGGRNLSCAGCHKQQYAFSDGNVTFSKGSGGALMERNTPGLFNLAWLPAMFWDGRAVSIEQQVFEPVRAHKEMNLDWHVAEKRVGNSALYKRLFAQAYGARMIDSSLIADAIGQFERTLISYRSKYDRVLAGEATFSLDEAEGFVLVNDMTKGDCLHCHTTDADALGTTGKFSNNGLDSISNAADYHDKGRGGITGKTADHGLFKIPSLRNVALTAPYMHDGRFKTLEEVVRFYASGVNRCANIDSKMEFVGTRGNQLTGEEQRKIVCFLNTLTDSAFITDTSLADPFRRDIHGR